MGNDQGTSKSGTPDTSEGLMVAGLIMAFILPIGGFVVAFVLLMSRAWQAALPLALLSAISMMVWYSIFTG